MIFFGRFIKRKIKSSLLEAYSNWTKLKDKIDMNNSSEDVEMNNSRESVVMEERNDTEPALQQALDLVCKQP